MRIAIILAVVLFAGPALAGEEGQGMMEQVKEGGKAAYGHTKEGAGVVIDKTKEGGKAAYGHTKEGAGVAVDKIKEGGKAVYEKAKDIMPGGAKEPPAQE